MNTASIIAAAPECGVAPDCRVAEATTTRRSAGVRRALLHLSPTVWSYFDIVLICAATFVTWGVMLRDNPRYVWVASPWISAAGFAGCISLAGLVFGLYERHTLAARSRILVRSASTLGVGVTLAYALLSVFFYQETTRWLGLSVALIYSGIAVPLRLLAHKALTHDRLNVVCVGSGESIRNIVQMLVSDQRPHYQIVGHINVSGAGTPERFGDDHADAFDRHCPALGDVRDIDRILGIYAIDEVVVDADLTANADVEAAVLACLDNRCRVTDQPTFFEKFRGEVPAEDISAHWFMLADVRSTGSYEAVKRILDVAAGALGLLLTAPLWPVIALAIRIDSPGPALYKQVRVGLHGRLFTIYKFRTMRCDAERDGAQWACANDKRVTLLGRILRRSRLDEFPQLWNILRGDMSLVGPRPERPEFVEQLARQIPHYRQRHLIIPGLSGWAQIHYGYGASVEDAQRKLCFDLYYLKHRSIDFDVAIMIRTIGRFVLGSR